ncbi:MAG: dTDP-glucose 4,6-dehydratase [Acidimicrobiales bacterium]|jgi:dTDP-glucose 4,6-dehydratase|nr:dTDP-glucose 4,6-dehydratase [Acidimicrobiales bacterium]HJL99138.1 dTDP-glucose 4,6-dehydratase [Acidimicrobiales bacterium]
MKILVTGGAGFIGSNFVRFHLANSDDEITILDSLTYAGSRDTLSDFIENPRISFVEGDICDREKVAATMEGQQLVVHFAAESHVDRSIDGSERFIITNCVGTNLLCDVAAQMNVQRFVHISTDETYGSRTDGSFTENDKLEPSSPYAASKAASDLIALGHHTTHDLPVVITRSSNNYGPFQFPEKLIPLFVTNLLDGSSVPLYGDGANVRDWIHVEDNCAAISNVLQNGEIGEIYNIGAGNEVSNLDLTKMLIKLCERDESAITRVEDRLGHDFRYSVDSTKIRDLGWAPQIDLQTGLEATVRWYRDNETWWRPKTAKAQ